MLNASTTTLIATPGKIARYGAVSRFRRPSPLSIAPQVGVGGGVPRPSKLTAASMTMAFPSHTVAMTRIGANTFGSTCRATIRPGEAPKARAASMNVCCLTASTVPRTTREAPGAITSAMTRMILVRLCPSTASTGARMATPTSPRMITALAAPRGLRRTSRHTAPHNPRSAADASSPPCDTAAAGAASAVTDSRIKPGVAQVDEQVRHHDHRGEEQHGALDQGVVAQQNGVEHQAADARLQKDELHDHGAPEQHGELLADHRHDRDE